MIRKFNYTGRKRIARSRVNIEIIPAKTGPTSFEASINLSGLTLPKNAEIFIEAYRRSFFRRFAFGTVSQITPPKDRSLGDLDPRALAMFRIKVVESAGKGRILAVADRIIPHRTEDEPANKMCLLPVDFVDLGQSIWRLDLLSDWPSLQLNIRIEDIREIARSNAHFLSLVYPEVVRQIFYKIVVEEDHTDSQTDPEDWMSQWLVFANLLGVKEVPPSGVTEPILQDKLKWIDDAVEAFCSNNKMMEKFAQAMSPGEK
jgi:hypothetical protein